MSEPLYDLAARRAAFLAEAKALGVHVLCDVDERGHREWAPANTLGEWNNVWVRDGNVDRKTNGVLILAHQRGK